MRIKSYFAESVQSAIGPAPKEFGDDVTLVMSHASALEARHLSEYDIVFAVDEAGQSESLAGATAQLEKTNAPILEMKAAVTPECVPPSKPRFTPAEMAFVLSVSR
jgi:hypothetical protein